MTLFHILLLWSLSMCWADEKGNSSVPVKKETASNQPSTVQPATGLSFKLCAVAKNEEQYIDEWLEYHMYLGFDHAHIYDNSYSRSSYLAGLPGKYGNRIKVTHMPGLGLQEHSYGKCADESATNNTWIAFIDMDEFIVLRKHANIREFLQEVAPNGGSVVLPWNLMGNNGALTHEPGPVLTRFTKCDLTSDHHVKTLAYAPHIHQVHVHYTLLKNDSNNQPYPTVNQYRQPTRSDSKFYHEARIFDGRGVAYLNHYHTKSFEEYCLKRRRGKAHHWEDNAKVADDTAEAVALIRKEFDAYQAHANAVEDTTARDFYLRHHLGKAYETLIGRSHDKNTSSHF